jgi:hypothetical protein
VARRSGAEVRKTHARQVGVRGEEAELKDGDLALEDFELLELRRADSNVGLAAEQVEIARFRDQIDRQRRVLDEQRG